MKYPFRRQHFLCREKTAHGGYTTYILPGHETDGTMVLYIKLIISSRPGVPKSP